MRFCYSVQQSCGLFSTFTIDARTVTSSGLNASLHEEVGKTTEFASSPFFKYNDFQGYPVIRDDGDTLTTSTKITEENAKKNQKKKIMLEYKTKKAQMILRDQGRDTTALRGRKDFF